MKDIRYRFDDLNVKSITPLIAAFGQDRFGFVITPNSDQLLRIRDGGAFRSAYEHAAFVVLDSRFVSHVLRWLRGVRLRVCTGSDLTHMTVKNIAKPDDRLVLIGCDVQQAQKLREKFGLTNLAHYNPPMGFINDPAAVEQTLRFIEAASPFRFCLLAVGCPQQEYLADMLYQRQNCRGLALCIGASINFLTGGEQRSPKWLRRLGLEWLYRLSRDPRRLARRYLVRGPQILPLLLFAGFGTREPAAPPVGMKSPA